MPTDAPAALHLDRHGEPARCVPVADGMAREGTVVMAYASILAAGERLRAGMTERKLERMGDCLQGLFPPCYDCGRTCSHYSLEPCVVLCPCCGRIICTACYMPDHQNTPGCRIAAQQEDAPAH
jgi:hypothetical protein